MQRSAKRTQPQTLWCRLMHKVVFAIIVQDLKCVALQTILQTTTDLLIPHLRMFLLFNELLFPFWQGFKLCLCLEMFLVLCIMNSTLLSSGHRIKEQVCQCTAHIATLYSTVKEYVVINSWVTRGGYRN